jgi:NAD(P)-dependent dehydrogenase (short-subunit alcohol dehydrogenase family)
MSGERTAIVTGAGKRVGAAIAEALVADGWTVLAHVHHEQDAVTDGATKVVADLADQDCAERIFAAVDGLPPVRLLLNNAARFAWDGFGEFSTAEFGAHMAVNVRAPALLIEQLAALQSEENFEAMHGNNPLGRGVEPADVVAALRYFIGATAVTGQVITIDSGQRFMALQRDVQFLGSR